MGNARVIMALARFTISTRNQLIVVKITCRINKMHVLDLFNATFDHLFVWMVLIFLLL